MDFNFDEHTVVYHKVATHAAFSEVTRQLAVNLMNTPYMTVGDFFRGLTDEQSINLAVTVDKFHEDDMSDEAMEIVTLATMLAHAEGVPPQDIDQATHQINAFVMLAACNALARRKMIDVFYDNFTLGDDYADKIIAKKRDDVDYGLGDDE